MIFRGPNFLAVVWFGSTTTLPPILHSVSSTGDTQEDWERETSCWRERWEGGGRGAESNIAWPSINDWILSGGWPAEWGVTGGGTIYQAIVTGPAFVLQSQGRPNKRPLFLTFYGCLSVSTCNVVFYLLSFITGSLLLWDSLPFWGFGSCQQSKFPTFLAWFWHQRLFIYRVSCSFHSMTVSQ